MFKYLEKLRSKPEAEKRKTVLFISLSITLVIVLIWIANLSFRFETADSSIEDHKKNQTPSLKETFSGFMDQVGDIINRSTTYENPDL